MNNVRGKNTKRKHLNKNKKKAWRTADINDVEEYLEDERLQERTGGKVAEKKDDDLFLLDNRKRDVKIASESSLTRKRKAQEKLKEAEETLNPPPAKKKDHRAPAIIQKEVNGLVSSVKNKAFEQRKAAKQEKHRKLVEKRKLPLADFDLWGDQLEAETKKEDEHFLTVTRKRRVNVPAHIHKPVSLLPAVEVPLPGSSYNPAFDDHQELLWKAHQKEEGKMKKEQKLHKQLDDYFPKVKDAPTEASKLEEMAEGLYEDDEEENLTKTVEDEEDERLSVNPPVRRENKKDEKSRRKLKEQKEKQKQLQLEKQRRIKDKSLFRLRSLKAEVKTYEAELGKRAKKREDFRAQELYRTKRLGKMKFEEPDMELKLSDELVGSLREIKPEGHLLEDRFRSFQKRNMLEPRGKAKRLKPAKHKLVEKRGHRAITS